MTMMMMMIIATTKTSQTTIMLIAQAVNYTAASDMRVHECNDLDCGLLGHDECSLVGGYHRFGGKCCLHFYLENGRDSRFL
jgi:hypothetical protein